MDNHHRAVQCRVAVQTKGLHDRPRLNKVSMRRKEGEMGYMEGLLYLRCGSLRGMFVSHGRADLLTCSSVWSQSDIGEGGERSSP